MVPSEVCLHGRLQTARAVLRQEPYLMGATPINSPVLRFFWRFPALMGIDRRQEIAQLRLIARDKAITAELWLRSKYGTWRFFLVTPKALVEIDREGKRLKSGQTVAYLAGIALGEGESTPSS